MSDKCSARLDGVHVYKYDGNDFACRCGKVVKYDIVRRDFEEKK